MQNESATLTDRIDVPMRAFAEGYYQNLIRMYNYLGVRYHSQPFSYSFEKTTVARPGSTGNSMCYFVFSSNLHRYPPIRPDGTSMLSWLIEICYVTICYMWWSLCCFWLPPRADSKSGLCETLGDYTQRIMLPQYFMNHYLLPLLSSVATCSHEKLLRFPAQDLSEYKRRSAGGKHYTVSDLRKVQTTLAAGIDARLSTTVTNVEALHDGSLEVEWATSDGALHEEVFDEVVLAVAPNIVGKIYRPLQKLMAQLPTTRVQSVVQGIGMNRNGNDTNASSERASVAQTIHLRTSLSVAQTEAIHVYPCGAMVTTSPLSSIAAAQNVLSTVEFTRTLRTPQSRRILNEVFGERRASSLADEKAVSWRNGDGNVWLVGGFCWDGMVLLEGCVVSAMRVATALDVNIPWRVSSSRG